jgi:hypothetical protein
MPAPTDPREAVRLIESEGVTHLCGARWWSSLANMRRQA